jgi:hypothetical protein
MLEARDEALRRNERVRSREENTMSTTSPLPGQMYMFDYMLPPLTDDSYRLRVNTNASNGADPLPIPEGDAYFNIVGPRFRLSAADVAGSFPPRNGHGDFTLSLPHIALYDRTLPWERLLDPTVSSPAAATPPAINGAVKQPGGRLPWIALLLLQEGEYSLLQNAPLESIVPPATLTAMELPNPSGITCDAVQVDLAFLQSILPAMNELALLTHVRQVNVDDRELDAGSSNGWFSVVMSNRLPAPGTKYRACLVSLEGRKDLWDPIGFGHGPVILDLVTRATETFTANGLTADATKAGASEIRKTAGPDEVAIGPVVHPVSPISPVIPVTPVNPISPVSPITHPVEPPILINPGGGVIGPIEPVVHPLPIENPVIIGTLSNLPIATQSPGLSAVVQPIRMPIRFNATASLVLLFSWQFECTGTGTFYELAQNLNVAMVGATVEQGHPPVTDTGHIAIQVGDRSGSTETAWYRGPLSPLQLTRDPLGPYHAADQARIATPETGGEDVSYAAAFEVGRLLAAADARLAQDLMRWRRNSYSASTFSDSLNAIQAKLPTLQPLDIHAPVTPLLTQSAAEKVVGSAGTLVDSYRMQVAARTPGMNPTLLQQALNLADTATAVNLMGGQAGVLGSSVTTQTQTTRNNATIADAAADSAGLQQLTNARTRMINNVNIKTGVTP